MLKILFFGDVVGNIGRKCLAKAVPELKKEFKPDLIIANAENIAHGVGITPKTLAECQNAGIDFFTSGNHVWKKPNVNEIFEDIDAPLIRPANYPGDRPGQGYKTIMVGEYQILVINLNGQVFIEEDFNDPFKAIDEILSSQNLDELAGVIIDFHAEATSEKVAMGWYVDGRVSALVGTHTHIQTADETTLPQGTAYITDIGMVGAKESVLGVDKDIILNNFTQNDKKAHDFPKKGECTVNAVIIELDPNKKQANKITRVNKIIEV